MSRFFDRLRFLWVEETASPAEVPRVERGEPAGVPRPLRIATRWALITLAATTLMGQVIGVRMVAPVDADTSYTGQCNATCDGQASTCMKNCAPGDTACRNNCATIQSQCHTGCSG